MDVVIYHNPDCGTSRNVLALIRNAGVEPHMIEFLKTPPSRAMLLELIGRMDYCREISSGRRGRPSTTSASTIQISAKTRSSTR